MKHATIDFETRSEVDLKKAGAYKYAQSLTTSILSLAYRLPGDTTTQLWIPGNPDPDDLLDYVYLGGLVEAHNSFFEHCIWNFVATQWPKMPLNQWRCSMAKARACGIPGGLDLAGAALSLDIQKDKRGKYLINKLCKPRRPTKNDPSIWVDDPALLGELYDYNITDVDAEMELSKHLPSMPQQEIDVWLLDQKINERGVFIDVEAVKATLKVLEQTTTKYNYVLKDISDGAFSTGNQRDRILKWCAEQGVDMTGLTKADVIKTLERKDLPQVVREVLTLRQSLSRSSTAKYRTILAKLAHDGRIHEVLQYHKAITGRWAGAGFQVQNLPRPTLDEDPEFLVDLLKTGDLDEVEKHFNSAFEVASSAIRSMIIAPPGKKLISADYGAIETRVLFWLAGVQDGLDTFARGECMYCHMAALIYGVPYEWIYEGYKKEEFQQTNMRAVGKAAVLGLGYQMGGPKFKEDCDTKGIDITESFAKQVVDTYRDEFSKVPTLWNRMEEAAISALAEPGRVTTCGKIKFKKKGKFLICRLPSGRRMRYPFPKLEMTVTPWGADKMSLSYMTLKEGRWTRVSTYGGKLVENCIAEGTPVLTGRGWVPIEEVSTEDKVHDGVEFVTHGGLAHKGTQTCVDIDGVFMTPDHRILTDEGWKTAAQQPQPYRPEIRGFGGHKTGQIRRKETLLGVPMRLWRVLRKSWVPCNSRCKKRVASQLWLLNQWFKKSQKNYSRKRKASAIRSVGQYENSLRESSKHVLGILWREGHNSVREMAELIREFLGRHVANVQARTTDRQNRQRQGVLSRELPMGYQNSKHEQRKIECKNRHPKRSDGHFRSSESFRHTQKSAELPNRHHVARRQTFYRTKTRTSSVLDIINCGPRQRFVVLGDNGPFIVHNCTQAIARDIMAEGLLRLEKYNYPVIMSVHDEAVSEVPKDFGTVAEYCQLMCTNPSWAEGLPLQASGWSGQRYRK